MSEVVHCRGYVSAVTGGPVGMLSSIFYDVQWTEGLVGLQTHIQPHARPQGDPGTTEIMAAPVGAQAWGTYSSSGLIWHVFEQETTSECGEPTAPTPVPPGLIPVEPPDLTGGTTQGDGA